MQDDSANIVGKTANVYVFEATALATPASAAHLSQLSEFGSVFLWLEAFCCQSAVCSYGCVNANCCANVSRKANNTDRKERLII